MTIIKISKSFFYALVLLLPFGTSKVFFTETSFYFGYHVFYHSIFVYLTDIVFCGLMLAWLWESYNSPSLPLNLRGGWGALFHRITTSVSQKPLYLFLLAFWLSLATSLLFSRETSIGLYGLIRFTETLLLFAYVRENVSRETYKPIFWLILAFSVFESLLGIGQYLTQSSFDWHFLGEPYLRPGLRGVAEFASSGLVNPILAEVWPVLRNVSYETINIRAYGTLSHPNVLAVFLYSGLMANIWLLYVSQKQKIILVASLLVISTGLVVTFSRTVWAAALLSLMVLGLVLWHLRRKQFHRMQSGQGRGETQSYFPKRIAFISMVLLVALGLNWFWFGQQIRDRISPPHEEGKGEVITPSDSPSRGGEFGEGVTDRKLYSNIAWQMTKAYPVFGVGLRNFVARMDEYNSGPRLLPYLHQPVHNIYLLILAELGIVGFAAFLWLLFEILRKGLKWGNGQAKLILLTAFGGFLFLGFFDHYFLSLHQGGLMFWIIAGLVCSRLEAECPSADLEFANR